MHKTTWVAVACAGVIAGGVVGAQPPKVAPAAGTATLQTTPPAPAEAPKSGADALTAMLGDSRTALGKFHDYACTFTRQELRNGTLSGEEVAEMKVRCSPLGVSVRFAKPDALAGAEIGYTAAKKSLKMRYRAAGGVGTKGFHSIDLDDKTFLAENRHPVTEWTMAAALDRVSAAVARERTLNNPVDVFTGEFQFARRPVTRYEVITRRPHAFRYAHRVLVYVDKETKLPVRFEAFDQPKSGGAVGELFEAYSYSDIKTDVGLGENTFDF
jgi:hypothetical protein